jgi:hypothetical protein
MSQVSFKLAAAVAFLGVAACSEPMTAPAAHDNAPNLNVASSASPGAWFGVTPPNNDGVEFWDNLSLDGEHCNVGFFANGPFGPCSYPISATPVSTATYQANEFYGQGTNGHFAAPFMFEPGTYKVVFLDGYRGNLLEQVGYFTKSGTVYTKSPIAPAVSSVINGTVTITVPTNWGLYIEPQEAVGGGDGCGGVPAAMCSDDSKVQQFALFRRNADNTYLVGIEDRPGVATRDGIVATSSLFPSGGGDKDFNDFFISVRQIAPTETLDGRMTGSGTDKASGVKASITIHCDNKLSNNIEIQGPGNLNWHLDKNSLTNIVCQLANNPAPPVAPINIFSGDATGTLNGVPGSKLSFTFIDNGEPGSKDRMSITIRNASNNVVLNLPLVTITNGNLQAHFDQPHKN